MGQAFFGWCIGFFMAAVFSIVFATPNVQWQSQAASRGYAEYCVPDGAFAWKGECEQ